MMQVRCQRCGWVFTLSRAAIGLAVAEAQQAQAEYYQEPCPKCRNVIKIQVKELRRRLPPDYVLPELPPKPEPIQVKKDEAKAEAPQPEAPPLPASPPEAKPKRPAAPKAEPAAQPEAAPKSKTRPTARTTTKSKPKAAPKRTTKK
ncbi:MAG TPA: hypothetical protein VJG32_15880 [Anaerolineae bacterium]|nr:hypothetical protein [Anaerolineae bacterium]